MLLSSSGSRPASISGYRFAGVLVDLARARLLVDEAEVAAGALPLKLLRAVCEADGALLSRQALFERIWPRQVVSDEALSKLVGRTRELLGPYGDALVTVRGQGVRLDAPIAAQFDRPLPPAAAPAYPVASPAAASATAWAPRWWRPVLLALGVVAMAGVAAAFWQAQRDPVISPGFALRASDLQAGNPDTASLIAAAFKAEADGEIVRARTLMRSVHDSDPSTPVPALMLAWWDANAGTDAARQWTAAARSRLRAGSPVYLRLLVDYHDARGRDAAVRGPVGALLALRPQAWRLQLARAHDQLAHREFAGALQSLQQIPLDIPDAARVTAALADRVSLGDAAAAALVTPAIRRDAMRDACLRGRFAYSRAALGEAIAAFDRCREAAQARRDYIVARDAANFAALAALEAGSADAIGRVDGAARLCHEENVQTCETEMLGLRAFLEARAGQTTAAAATLADAWQRNHREWVKPPLLLLALENGLPAPADPAEVARGVPGDVVFGGVAELLLAWQEFARGDRQAARQQLERAREHGIAQTYHAEDAALLAARLGQAPAPCRMDPPYPNVVRLAACVALRSVER